MPRAVQASKWRKVEKTQWYRITVAKPGGVAEIRPNDERSTGDVSAYITQEDKTQRGV
jgi:hypothetical protein